jgi:hypothetical protein
VLAAKTGELTNKLSIPASIIESEQAFSVASHYATKIRSHLSDQAIDNFSFAKFRFKNDKLKLVNIQILSFIISTSVVNLVLALHKHSPNAIFRCFFLYSSLFC